MTATATGGAENVVASEGAVLTGGALVVVPPVGVLVAVTDCVGVAVPVGVELSVGVEVSVGVDDSVGVELSVGVADPDEVPVGLGLGLTTVQLFAQMAWPAVLQLYPGKAEPVFGLLKGGMMSPHEATTPSNTTPV